MTPREPATPAAPAAATPAGFEVCVRGSGAVALAAALALGRRGHAVALQAEISTPRVDVRAYALSLASVRLLESLKVWDALPPDAITAVQDMRIEGDRPGAVLHFSAWSGALDALTWLFLVPREGLEPSLPLRGRGV